MKEKFVLLKHRLSPLLSKLQFIKDRVKALIPEKKPHSEKFYKRIAFLNKYSLIFHFILACFLIFVIEVISRRNLVSAITFLNNHTLAFLYNALIIFASLTLVYLTKYRAQLRLLISGLWIFLGTVNGLILSNRVTPFSYTDLKCISDLFQMQNTTYFTATEATIVVSVVVAFFVFLGLFFAKGPKYQGKRHAVLVPVSILVFVFVGIPVTTQAAQSSNILASYFSNIAQGYSDYGFVYGFSTSVVGRGMNKPADYSEETIDAIGTLVNSASAKTNVDVENQPNIICVLLESFADPYEVNFLNMSEDPIPNFHYLEDNFSTGYLTVPVVGAGTANTEFEVLTGMSMQYFGTGEYPYKTILKQTDCESIASDLSRIGYGTHVVHNNTATFYSRNNAFSMMGFDSFTSKELMNITDYTPIGSWPTDDVLVGETVKAMDATEGQSDFVYTITVEGHGDYPTEKVLENPAILVTGAADEASNNQWEYYVNMIHEVDDFIGDLITAVDERGEDTIIVFFGDHLPTMGLTDEDMKSGSIFKTKYITWNNMGLAKEDADITAYQLLAQVTGQVGIHEGTILRYHQTQADSETYLSGLENLQYDLLYGKRYAYNGEDLYPATELVMDVEDVAISSVRKNNYSDTLTVYGSNFTKNTKIFVNGSKVSTKYLTPTMISTDIANVKDGDIITVNILGSKSILLRAGVGEVIYVDPDVVHETETTETETTETETTEAGNTETETTETENTESSEIETQSSEAESSETESSETTPPIITRLK
ncbi:MAG: LTA synthase family protein [Clostridiales bacterium]|nr:LTA synthase family protein [Roseburia sp.]MDD7635475.1 LTA synthase family protein [Clostridiales bacterium]MDY4112586.1 LTA synthase family protein [Roseburia sp.]